MCTVTWWNDEHSYEVFFNRDELKSRLPEIPPTLSILNNTRFLSPKDGNAGGTWLTVNEHGVTVGLLNYYPKVIKSKKYKTSRGLLVQSLADCVNAEQVVERLAKENLKNYAPFKLFCLELGSEGMVWSWDGRVLRNEPDVKEWFPYTSSSFRSDEVIQTRRHLFFDYAEKMGELSPEHLNDFHQYRIHENGAYGVCMEREDARTVSYCRIVVRAGKVRFDYAPRLKGAHEIFGDTMSVELDALAH